MVGFLPVGLELGEVGVVAHVDHAVGALQQPLLQQPLLNNNSTHPTLRPSNLRNLSVLVFINIYTLLPDCRRFCEIFLKKCLEDKKYGAVN